MDVFMIVMTCILALLLIIVNIYLLAYYCSPDDRGFGSAMICKIVVVIGMTLSWAQVLMLPLDVSNARGDGGAIRMDIFWLVIYISTAVFLLFIIPALTFYYEADEKWSCWEKVKYSFCYLIITIVVVILILIITFVLLSKADIPIKTVNCSFVNVQKSDDTTFKVDNCATENSSLTIDVSFPIFVIGLMSFISWFLFAVFGGIGLAALPLDFFYDFCTRPKKISQGDLRLLKEKTLYRAKEIKSLLDEYRDKESEINKAGFWNSEKRKYKETLNKAKAGMMVVEDEFYKISIQEDINTLSTWTYWVLPVYGTICLLLSLAWFLHILLYFIIKIDGKPAYPFLNNLFTALVENNVSFLATAFFAMFCLYLLWASTKGNIKFGLRIFLCWAIHPMKKDETYMNSFLFNVGLILLTSVSVTQFCAASFRDYAAMTDIDLIFSTQIRYLYFFVYFYKYHIFEYALFGIFVLASIYLLCRPSDVNSVDKLLIKREEELKLKANSDSNIEKRN